MQTPKRPTLAALGAAALAALVGLAPLAPSQANAAGPEDVAGPYLAMRIADRDHDLERVVEYGTRALARDPSNAQLMERLVLAQVGLGQIDAALPIARRLHALAPENQVAGLVLIAEAIRRGDWARMQKLMEQGLSIGPGVDNVLLAWANVGRGRMSQAIAEFQALAAAGDGFAGFHQALALALAGDFESAAAVFSQANARLDRAGVIAHAEILSQLGRNDEALALLDASFASPDAEIAALRARLAQGEAVPFDVIRSPADGAAEVFLALAQSLAGELDPTIVLLYARVAGYLRPDLAEATVLAASLLNELGLPDLAAKTYAEVPKDSRLHLFAERARAELLRAQGRSDEAIALLRALTERYGDRPALWRTLGDTLRAEKRWAEAAQAYDRAIQVAEARGTQEGDWVLYFYRGISHEKTGDWPAAEADFRKALALNPDQPVVLNYLGYSLVERHANLDEALELIKRAVAARPDDGYTVDSLGWVLYRLGRYDEAVAQMERAVELEPTDPIINDHLGDVYWAVGREREARFQWKRALSFADETTDPSEFDPARVRRKLEVGLDKVLKEEGAPPLIRPDAPPDAGR